MDLSGPGIDVKLTERKKERKKEFGQYMVVGVESLSSMANVMKEPILFYMHIFMGRMGKFA